MKLIIYEDDSYCYELSTWSVISDRNFEYLFQITSDFQRKFFLSQEMFSDKEVDEILEQFYKEQSNNEKEQ